MREGLVDIMLMSASTSYALTIRERIFENSHVTAAVRANDTTDIHLARGGRYSEEPSRPFRSASIDHIQCGHLDCEPEERRLGANLGLYSVTFNNDLARDLTTLERFRDFREEAERKGFRYFLEVFDPNVPGRRGPRKARCLHQRHDRADARGCGACRQASVSQDGLPRATGDRGHVPLRPAPDYRHPWRIGGDYARRLPTSL